VVRTIPCNEFIIRSGRDKTRKYLRRYLEIIGMNLRRDILDMIMNSTRNLFKRCLDVERILTGTANIYVCIVDRIEEGCHLAARVVFVCLVRRNMLMTL
jgi:hypothetical protein